MRLINPSHDAVAGISRLSLSFAGTPEEIREVQSLRYEVFIEEAGLSDLVNQRRIDQDEFDDYCDHLIIRDAQTLKAVGTYRVLGPRGAQRCGRFYSEQEFDLARLRHLRTRIVEAGRACIHPDYRGGGVLMLLWAGLAQYMKKEQCDYLIGCASIGLKDGGHNAKAIYRELNGKHLAPAEYRVTPHLPYPVGNGESGGAPRIPSLLKGYLRSGAWICGEPAWDANFHCADLFMLLSLERMESRYARHYKK